MSFEIKDGVLVKYNGNTPDVIIPSCVTAIGEKAFKDNKFLKSVIITGNVKKICSWAFSYCNNLEKIVIPESVTEIGDSAFWRCYNLEKITIPESVTKIDDCAFYGCNNLKKIVIPESVTEIGFNAFVDTHWFKNKWYTEKNVVIVNGIAISKAYNIEESVNLEGVKKMRMEIFQHCGQIKEFVISDGITIYGNAFLTGNDFNICLKHNDFSVNIPVSKNEIQDNSFKERTRSLFNFIGSDMANKEILFDDLEIPEYRYPIAVFMANAYKSEFFKTFIDVHLEKIHEYAENNDPGLLKFITVGKIKRIN